MMIQIDLLHECRKILCHLVPLKNILEFFLVVFFYIEGEFPRIGGVEINLRKSLVFYLENIFHPILLLGLFLLHLNLRHCLILHFQHFFLEFFSTTQTSIINHLE